MVTILQEAEVKNEESTAAGVSKSAKKNVKPVDPDPHGEKLLQVDLGLWFLWWIKITLFTEQSWVTCWFIAWINVLFKMIFALARLRSPCLKQQNTWSCFRKIHLILWKHTCLLLKWIWGSGRFYLLFRYFVREKWSLVIYICIYNDYVFCWFVMKRVEETC